MGSMVRPHTAPRIVIRGMGSAATLAVVVLLVVSLGAVRYGPHTGSLPRAGSSAPAGRPIVTTVTSHANGRPNVRGAATRASARGGIVRDPAQESNQTLYVTESGLPWSVFGVPYLAVTWYVILNGMEYSSNLSGQSVDSIQIQGLDVGEYNYTIPNVAPNHVPYPSSGTFNMTAAESPCCVEIGALFSPLYTMTFNETGLPAGMIWGLTFNGTTGGSNGSSVQFAAPNGTYSYAPRQLPSYAATPAAGTVTIDGHQTRASIRYTPISFYQLSFTETGFDPTATSWSVFVGGNQHSSFNNTISISEPSGTYHYNVSEPSNRESTPVSGNVTINGTGQTTPITFITTYYVNLNETGLPDDALWFFNLSDGKTWASPYNFIVFSLANGSYPYTVATLAPGYSAPSGTLTINGEASTEVIAFSNGANASGSSNLTTVVIPAIVVAAVLIAVGSFVVVRRRRRTPPQG
jgi:hypothetical protein